MRSARRLGPAIRLARGRAAARRRLLTPFALSVPQAGVLTAVRRLRRDRNVAYAEPDYLMRASATPNDSSFSLQWGSSNTGQSIPTQNAQEELGAPASGTAGADDRALAAWGVSTGSRSIVIGETDTGVDYNHPDLAANVWSNPGGIGGCAAGTHGYNQVSGTCNPMDDDSYYGGHGSHVAGIMGAVANNGVGVAGMNWQTTILPVKWLNSSASGSTSGLIAALQWLVAAKQAGVNVRVVNDSATFWGTAYSQALSDEIDTLGANNILFVTAAGNTGNNNDETAVRRYPCGYDRPTEICVTASNNNDQLPSWANYGPNTVDLAAPGVSIYSTLRNGSYGYLSGGSMASPQVAGAAALILSTQPSLSATALKADILENVDKLPSLAGKVITGGRLNVCKAIPGCGHQAPPAPLTFGKTSVGAFADGGIFADYKVVHAATLTVAGSVSKLSMYAIPGANAPSPQALKAVIYSDVGGSPGALVATGGEVTYRSSSNGSGWFDLPFAAPVALPPGTYWLGFITGASSEGIGYAYDNVEGSRAYNQNTYTSGPTNLFGSSTKDAEQASIYATYTTTRSLSPRQQRRTHDFGDCAERADAERRPGLVDGKPDQLRLPVAALRLHRGELRRDLRRHGADLPDRLARCGLHTARRGDGFKLGRIICPCELHSDGDRWQQGSAKFGKTSVGASSDRFATERKRVSRYALSSAGSITKLSIYLAPTGTAGQQLLKGLIYADSAGAPGALLGVSEQLSFASTGSAGWYDLTFSSPLKLAAGNYWIGAITGAGANVAGFRYDSVAGSRDYNANTYTSGPTNPFGSVSSDSEQTSLYATYTPASPIRSPGTLPIVAPQARLSALSKSRCGAARDTQLTLLPQNAGEFCCHVGPLRISAYTALDSRGRAPVAAAPAARRRATSSRTA